MNSDFKDLLCCLNAHKVRYLVIGGYAVSIHTEPRYTKDLDIWVEPTLANSRRLVKALLEFGAPVDSLTQDDFAKPDTLFIFGIPPARVDILNHIKGAQFSAMFTRRVSIELDDFAFHCISATDLIRLKEIANRPQDRIDIRALKKTLPGQPHTQPKRRNRL